MSDASANNGQKCACTVLTQQLFHRPSDVFDDLVIGVYSITRDGQAIILKDPTRNLTFQWAMINP